MCLEDKLLNIENENIKKLIYTIRGKQVMLDSEIYASKCHYCLYDKIITHYDIGRANNNVCQG